MRGRNLKREATKAKPKVLRSYKYRTLSYYISLFVLTLLLLWACAFISCRSEDTSNQSRSSIEQRKAELLKQLELKFENPDVHFELGQLYQAEGNWAEAEHCYSVALDFEPAHRSAQAVLVKGLVDNGETAKAEQYAKSYINRVSGSTMACLQLADLFHKQGLDKYALTCYKQALSLEPNSSEVNKQLGYYYLSKDDKVQAKDYLSRSFQLNPNQPDVAGELGRLGVVVKIPRQAGYNPSKEDESTEQSDI